MSQWLGDVVWATNYVTSQWVGDVDFKQSCDQQPDPGKLGYFFSKTG